MYIFWCSIRNVITKQPKIACLHAGQHESSGGLLTLQYSVAISSEYFFDSLPASHTPLSTSILYQPIESQYGSGIAHLHSDKTNMGKDSSTRKNAACKIRQLIVIKNFQRWWAGEVRVTSRKIVRRPLEVTQLCSNLGVGRSNLQQATHPRPFRRKWDT